MASKEPTTGKPKRPPSHKRTAKRKTIVDKKSARLIAMNKANKGRKRPEGSGRKKGTPNKRSMRIRDSVNDYLRAKYPEMETFDFDPVFEIVDVIMHEKKKRRPNRQVIADQANRLLPYYHPTRKAIEFEPDDSELPKLQIVLTDMVDTETNDDETESVSE